MLPTPVVRPLMLDVRDMVREQVEYRELLAQMVRRDLVLRYKQTIMGFGWAVFMPLVNTAVFWVVFTRVAPIDTGVPYLLYAFSGLLAWNFTASALRFAVTSLTGNGNLVSKIYFPREIFPFSAVLVSAVDLAVGSLALFALMAWYRVVPGWPIVLLPVVALVHVALTGAIALMLAMAHLFYRDVKYLFDIVINVAMFATSVVYPVRMVGGGAGELLMLNPMTIVIDAYRAVLFGGAAPAWGPLAGAAAASSLLLAAAWSAFHRAERAFAEHL